MFSASSQRSASASVCRRVREVPGEEPLLAFQIVSGGRRALERWEVIPHRVPEESIGGRFNSGFVGASNSADCGHASVPWHRIGAVMRTIAKAPDLVTPHPGNTPALGREPYTDGAGELLESRSVGRVPEVKEGVVRASSRNGPSELGGNLPWFQVSHRLHEAWRLLGWRLPLIAVQWLIRPRYLVMYRNLHDPLPVIEQSQLSHLTTLSEETSRRSAASIPP